MGVVRDVTVDNLVTAVGNIDTSSLAQDSTLQNVVTAIGNISGGNDPVTNTTVNNLGKDTTLQRIASAISALTTAVKPDASDIPYDSNLSVKGKIDDVVNAINTTTANITRHSSVSSSVGLPVISRRGKVVIIHFATQIPAGTYYNLYKATPTPTTQEHTIVTVGPNVYNITILSDGIIRFNNSITISSSSYIIGQLVYLTDLD